MGALVITVHSQVNIGHHIIHFEIGFFQLVDCFGRLQKHLAKKG